MYGPNQLCERQEDCFRPVLLLISVSYKIRFDDVCYINQATHLLLSGLSGLSMEPQRRDRHGSSSGKCGVFKQPIIHLLLLVSEKQSISYPKRVWRENKIVQSTLFFGPLRRSVQISLPDKYHISVQLFAKIVVVYGRWIPCLQ